MSLRRFFGFFALLLSGVGCLVGFFLENGFVLFSNAVFLTFSAMYLDSLRQQL